MSRDRRPRRARAAQAIKLAVARLRGSSEVTCQLFDGQAIRVVLPELVGRDLYLHGMIEPAITRLLLENLRLGMVFVDVGAQYGYFSLLASRLVGPAGNVVAFEPARDTVRLLRRNTAQLANVVVEEAAVAEQAGSRRIRDYGPRHSALNTLLSTARVPAAERSRLVAHAYDVPAVTLDEYVAAHDLRPDIVKLDAEGAELAILEGMRGVLRDDRPLIALETGDYDGMASPPTSASIDLLEGAGYVAHEYEHGLQQHARRERYGYGNLIFVPTD